MNKDKNQYLDHPIQAIMSRTGSFPLKVAYDLLAEHGNDSTIVLDPFCGKGTTLLAARMLGFRTYGIDVAPEAVICSSAKLSDVTSESVVSYVDGIELCRSPLSTVPAPIQKLFHPITLTQLLSIRNQVINDMRFGDVSLRAQATFVMAALLGILHGHASYALSISSAHAFSMSPTYVEKFAAKHGLQAPVRDVKSCLITKALRCLKVPLPEPVEGEVRIGSAMTCSKIFPELNQAVDLILTSPPYLNAQTYAKDNWLRLWLLGYDHKILRAGYIETGSIQRYEGYMRSVLKELTIMLKPGGKLICIAGDVRRPMRKKGTGTTVFETGTFLAELCGSSEIGLKIEGNHIHTVSSNNRYFHALNRTNGHSRRDLIERTFILHKPERVQVP